MAIGDRLDSDFQTMTITDYDYDYDYLSLDYHPWGPWGNRVESSRSSRVEYSVRSSQLRLRSLVGNVTMQMHVSCYKILTRLRLQSLQLQDQKLKPSESSLHFILTSYSN